MCTPRSPRRQHGAGFTRASPARRHSSGWACWRPRSGLHSIQWASGCRIPRSGADRFRHFRKCSRRTSQTHPSGGPTAFRRRTDRFHSEPDDRSQMMRLRRMIFHPRSRPTRRIVDREARRSMSHFVNTLPGIAPARGCYKQTCLGHSKAWDWTRPGGSHRHDS